MHYHKLMKTLKSLIHSATGFSLPELMMAAAIMGVLAVGFMKLTQNGVEGGKRVEAGAQLNEVKNESVGILSNRDACINTFALSNDFSDVMGGTPKIITSIKDKNNIIRFSSGSTYPGGVKLNSITVKDYDALKKTAGLFMDFSYNLNSAKVMQKTRRFDLQLELSGNTLQSCVALAGVQNIDLQQLCDGVIGFDPAGASYFTSGECQFAKASCQKGGGVWDGVLEKCGLGYEQQFNVRKSACDSERGYFMRINQGWSFSIEGLTTSSMCTVADITSGKKCFCRTDFMAQIWSNPPAPTEPDSTGYPSKRLSLSGGRFNIVSPIFTLSNPFPDSDSRPRFVKMSAKIHIDNVSSDGKQKWLTMAIGCYRPGRFAYRPQLEWFPSILSSDWTTVHAVGGYKFQTDDFREVLANGTQVGNTGPASLVPISRGNYFMHSGGGIYLPGDKCAVMVYTHDSGVEVLVGAVNTSSQHSTLDTNYGYGPSSWPVSNGF